MSRTGSISRWRAARRERGAAVMLVVLILTMLMGIGLFAARTAQLSVGASGYDRQMTQTHYITQYGMLAATSELSVRPSSYVALMAGDVPGFSQPDPTCQNGLFNPTNLPNYTCARIGFQDVQAILGAPLLPATPGTALGNGNIEADWLVEMSNLAPVPKPVAGMSQNPEATNDLKFVVVTLTATGQVRPINAGPTGPLTQAASASIETQRARVIVGPIKAL